MQAQSSRAVKDVVGRQKPFFPFAGDTLLSAVIARFAPQTDQLMLNLRPEATEEARRRYPYPILYDATGQERGPLGGVLAALDWARTVEGDTCLATVPADTPFLPEHLVTQLKAAAAEDAPVFACDAERAHYLCALWPMTSLEPLRKGFASGRLASVRRAHEALGSVACHLASIPRAFFKVNTPEDLARAEEIRRRCT